MRKVDLSSAFVAAVECCANKYTYLTPGNLYNPPEEQDAVKCEGWEIHKGEEFSLNSATGGDECEATRKVVSQEK